MKIKGWSAYGTEITFGRADLIEHFHSESMPLDEPTIQEAKRRALEKQCDKTLMATRVADGYVYTPSAMYYPGSFASDWCSNHGGPCDAIEALRALLSQREEERLRIAKDTRNKISREIKMKRKKARARQRCGQRKRN